MLGRIMNRVRFILFSMMVVVVVAAMVYILYSSDHTSKKSCIDLRKNPYFQDRSTNNNKEMLLSKNLGKHIKSLSIKLNVL